MSVGRLLMIVVLTSCAGLVQRPVQANSMPPWDPEELVQSAATQLLWAIQAEEYGRIDERGHAWLSQLLHLEATELLAWYVSENTHPAFQARQDGVPVPSHAALLWLRFRFGSSGPRWALVQLGRFPEPEKEWTQQWHGIAEPHQPHTASCLYARAPRNADVLACLHPSPGLWSPAAERGWNRVEGGVRRRAWRRTIGQAPPEALGLPER